MQRSFEKRESEELILRRITRRLDRYLTELERNITSNLADTNTEITAVVKLAQETQADNHSKKNVLKQVIPESPLPVESRVLVQSEFQAAESTAQVLDSTQTEQVQIPPTPELSPLNSETEIISPMTLPPPPPPPAPPAPPVPAAEAKPPTPPPPPPPAPPAPPAPAAEAKPPTPPPPPPKPPAPPAAAAEAKPPTPPPPAVKPPAAAEAKPATPQPPGPTKAPAAAESKPPNSATSKAAPTKQLQKTDKKFKAIDEKKLAREQSAAAPKDQENSGTEMNQPLDAPPPAAATQVAMALPYGRTEQNQILGMKKEFFISILFIVFMLIAGYFFVGSGFTH